MTTVVPDQRDYAPDALFRLTGALALSDRNVRRLLSQVIGHGECDPAEWLRKGILPRRFQNLPALPRLHLRKTLTSPSSGFQKLVFETCDGLSLESVLIPLHKAGSVSVCLSSQVGCVMGCSFCATGRMTKQRDLQTWEIVDQFIQARSIVRASGRRVTGAVFMGMGEPFLNYDRVLAAAELLCFPIFDAISANAITISTVGILSGIERFTSEGRPFRLSISLGAAMDEKRKLIVPVAAHTPVARVMEAARRYALTRRERVMLSYVCISDLNVSESDARALGELIKDTPVRLDLIDVADSTGRYLPPTQSELGAFRDALRIHVGQPVARRFSGGQDISAACGTLGGG